MRVFKIACFLVFSAVMLAANVSAANITISDNRTGTGSSWYSTGSGQGAEDQEVEPGMIANQNWDLEGFFLEEKTLSMVGGYNFKSGYDNMKSGDIFLDTSNPLDAIYGGIPRTSTTTYANNYDYVISFGRNSNGILTGNYNVYSLANFHGTLLDVLSYNQRSSSPWRYNPNLNSDQSLENGTFTFTSGLSNLDTGFLGGTHYSIGGINLSFLPNGTTFIAHYTMECGNDNLMGKGTAHAPEPSTLILLGSGLIAAVAMGRKMKVRK
jgi:hypothetical protein